MKKDTKQQGQKIDKKIVETPVAITAKDIDLIDELKTPKFCSNRIKRRYPHLNLSPHPNDGLDTMELLDKALGEISAEIGMGLNVDTSIFQALYNNGAPQFIGAQSDSASHFMSQKGREEFALQSVPIQYECVEVGTFNSCKKTTEEGVEGISVLAKQFAEIFEADATSTFGWMPTPDRLVVQVSLYEKPSPS